MSQVSEETEIKRLQLRQEKLKIELDALKFLEERALQRFMSRREIEWRTAFGVWGFLGTTAWYIYSTKDVPVNFAVCAVMISIAVFLLLLMAFYWLPYLAVEFERDQKTACYWENQITRIVERPLPDALHPSNGHSGWPDNSLAVVDGSFSDHGNLTLSAMPKMNSREYWRLGSFFCVYRRTQWLQLSITAALTIAFVAAFVVRSKGLPCYFW